MLIINQIKIKYFLHKINKKQKSLSFFKYKKDKILSKNRQKIGLKIVKFANTRRSVH